MKSPIKLVILILTIGIFGCEKQTDNPAVDAYINQLRSNTYGSYELPAFTPSDIPALLSYRNETTVITNFPRNGISSFHQTDCKLGIYVLWTIESIRAVEIKSKSLIGRFPSQNPVLALNISTELKLVFDDNSLKEAAKAYYHWWNALYIFTGRMERDPLDETEYKWH